ncbi:MAG: HEAT repeat domain-containing protein, partial [Planctomycetes bacterium]|nr:HEAT repeat domain-containing protein [Planctomycetota bacterium]
MLLNDETVGVVKQAVCQAGPVVIPHLIAAVDDLEFRRRVGEDTQESMHLFLRRSEPLETVLECLERYAPESAVAAISRLVEDNNKEIRKQAALTLGTIASDETAESLLQSLSDEDDYVRSYAMMGLLRALDAERGSQKFRKAMFEAILPLVSRHDQTVSGD